MKDEGWNTKYKRQNTKDKRKDPYTTIPLYLYTVSLSTGIVITN
jgi:hypothetical protein